MTFCKKYNYTNLSFELEAMKKASFFFQEHLKAFLKVVYLFRGVLFFLPPPPLLRTFNTIKKLHFWTVKATPKKSEREEEEIFERAPEWRNIIAFVLLFNHSSNS